MNPTTESNMITKTSQTLTETSFIFTRTTTALKTSIATPTLLTV